MTSRHKRKGKSKFIMIEAYVKRSAAWKALTPIERCAYLEVKWRYDGTNNGRIGLGCRELGDELGMGRDTAKRALNKLASVGFIAKVKASAFNVKSRAVTEWRLTEYPCDVTGLLPSKEFMRWEPAKNLQAHPSDTQAHPCDTTLPKMADFIGHRRTHRTVKANSSVSQAHPSDTYRYTMGGKANEGR